MTRQRTALAAALAALAAVGCSGTGDPEPARREAPPAGTGYFVGRDAEGLGASVDLFGVDPVSRAVRGAFAPDARGLAGAPVVAIASVVNGGGRPVPTPRFAAVMRSGAVVPMPAARGRLPARGAAGRRALALIGPSRARVPAGGSATAYLVLRGVDPTLVATVRMVSEPGEPLELRLRAR